jgi:tRNA pseudouridine38-40 synthase
MNNILLKLMFDGTNYHGFQIQPQYDSVAGKLKEALEKITGEEIATIGSSRTDAGVHANGFYVSFKTDYDAPNDKFIYSINSLLPDDIKVVELKKVPEDFHARYSAVGKEYVYLIYNAPVPNPFYRNTALFYRKPIDVERLQKAANAFVGTHDFTAFSTDNGDKRDPVKTIYSFKVEKEGDMVKLVVRGNGFLYHMVRSMVGTLIFVNDGKIDPEDIKTILAEKKRGRAGKTAAAKGLYLNQVFYSMEDLLSI